MYRISCLTNGQCIKVDGDLAWLMRTKMPTEIQKQVQTNLYISSWNYLEFKTEEAAKWFISHRLVYNPRRKDESKLNFMRELFKFNDIPGWETCKIEFEILKA